MASDRERVTVDGHTFWRSRQDGQAVELTTATAIELDGEECRWTVAPPSRRTRAESIASDSGEVRRFMNGVLGAMRRAAYRSAPVQPIPKPTSVVAPLPSSAPVPCPLCQGSAWPDCEFCDGEGFVSQRRAAEWDVAPEEDHD